MLLVLKGGQDEFRRTGDRRPHEAVRGVEAWELTRRIPVILRIDGRAFHTITRKRFGKSWSWEWKWIK